MSVEGNGEQSLLYGGIFLCPMIKKSNYLVNSFGNENKQKNIAEGRRCSLAVEGSRHKALFTAILLP